MALGRLPHWSLATECPALSCRTPAFSPGSCGLQQQNTRSASGEFSSSWAVGLLRSPSSSSLHCVGSRCSREASTFWGDCNILQRQTGHCRDAGKNILHAFLNMNKIDVDKNKWIYTKSHLNIAFDKVLQIQGNLILPLLRFYYSFTWLTMGIWNTSADGKAAELLCNFAKYL